MIKLWTATTLTLVAAWALPSRAQQPFTEADCGRLLGATIALSRIGLPTNGATVNSADMIETPTAGRYCRVSGVIRPLDTSAPDIRFTLGLPERWNTKAIQLGGGGFDGMAPSPEGSRFPLPDSPSPIKQGYAVFGSDSGHVMTPPPPGSQTMPAEAGAFAMNAEALTNFAGAQLKKTHDVAIALITQAYGRSPSRMYFQGNSQGGHEALAAIQRWPRDYDGAIAIHPVYNLLELHLDGVLLGQALYNHAGAWLSPAKQALLATSILKSCDELDGLKDGIVANVSSCEQKFDLALLRCPHGVDEGDACLSDPQLTMLHTLTSPMPLGVLLPTGDTFVKWPLLDGVPAALMSGTFGPSGDRPAAGSRNTTFTFSMGDQSIRYIVMHDVEYSTMDFDPRQHVARLQEVAAQLDDASVDLDAFKKHGGKLLLMHGTIDMAVTPYNSIAYWQRLLARYKAAGLNSFARFYLAPGFGHGNGPFRVGWDSVGTLDAWVDQGIAPAQQVVVDTNADTRGRSLPLCEYPAFPRYQGKGDPNSASSFRCSAR
jgi:pimeloyl-ACP methyl ester carboxylesterase